MRSWLLGIVLTAFASGLARQLAPQGREQAMVRLAGGLLLTLAILRPLAGMDWQGPALEAGSFRVRTEEQAEIYRKNQRQAVRNHRGEDRGIYIGQSETAGPRLPGGRDHGGGRERDSPA